MLLLHRRHVVGVDDGARASGGPGACFVDDQTRPLFGQADELVGAVVEAGVDAMLEVGRRRDFDAFLLFGKHFCLTFCGMFMKIYLRVLS